MEKLYKEFTNLAKNLNSIGIIPVLYGSLGLSKLINQDLNSQDIDVLIPENFLKKEWDQLKIFIEKLGYDLIDLHEHEFNKNGITIAFASEEDLLPFADIDYTKLEVIQDMGNYKTLRIDDYLKVYEKSLIDGYRKIKNDNKDQIKIEIIKENLK
ncbi:hypothetical protein GW933_04210 [Candidatus Falkowbacteria bacterium]|uniref:Phosphoribosylanthranilate isomerase n=1 Tax=Candidatus Buchananbacteria bacterium CG10_big_fil_rev_8_21_14_0_10_33_19 TaxID=1974525 RepID=A0A2H0W789_9BACT|nr:hypothetical protein [Candidatus Falkowbacteria bacterium]PIS06461.1 MAG: hypothetical protein COT80_00785 [Candidatus Buchananbacteria bacterium CG10_big_fil_rev_8_21_14_0_10_33_19]